MPDANTILGIACVAAIGVALWLGARKGIKAQARLRAEARAQGRAEMAAELGAHASVNLQVIQGDNVDGRLDVRNLVQRTGARVGDGDRSDELPPGVRRRAIEGRAVDGELPSDRALSGHSVFELPEGA